MITTHDIKRAIDKLENLKKYPEHWTSAEGIKLWEVIHIVDSRVQGNKKTTAYTKTEIDQKLQGLQLEIEFLRGRMA